MNEQDHLKKLHQELADIAALSGTCCIWKTGSSLTTEVRLKQQRMHDCRFCLDVKKKYGSNICIRHDTETVAGRLRVNEPQAELIRCPAGAVEYMIPVSADGRILGAVLSGPYRGVTGDPELPEWRKKKAPALERMVNERIAPLCRKIYLETHSDGIRDQRIASVLDYMKENLSQKITLKSAANHVFLSESRLSHLFTAVCGEDFSSHLVKLRVNEAKILLRDTLLPIGEITMMCGFISRSNFSAVFKKHTGHPPAGYRKMIKKTMKHSDF